jgi:hypothetical protein
MTPIFSLKSTPEKYHKPEIGAVFFCILGTLAAICASKRAMTGLSVTAERDGTVHDSHVFSPIG